MLVSAADGDLSLMELVRLSGALSHVDPSERLALSEKLATRLKKNWKKTVPEIEAMLESFRGSASEASEILRVARLAVVADGRISESEENMMGRIVSLLKRENG